MTGHYQEQTANPTRDDDSYPGAAGQNGSAANAWTDVLPQLTVPTEPDEFAILPGSAPQPVESAARHAGQDDSDQPTAVQPAVPAEPAGFAEPTGFVEPAVPRYDYPPADTDWPTQQRWTPPAQHQYDQPPFPAEPPYGAAPVQQPAQQPSTQQPAWQPPPVTPPAEPGWWQPTPPAAGQPTPPPAAGQPTPTPAPVQPPAAGAAPRPEDLLAPSRPPVGDAPAQRGWRGRVHRLSGGALKPKPTPDELADRQSTLDIQRAFSRPMTIVVIQPKGGAGKTPTTIGLASALGAHRGGYVVGWDDNETRGTLGVRVANLDGQQSTVWDLLGALPEFERADARVGDLARYVRGQAEANFDALVSDDNPANMAQIGEEEFRRIHAVLQRFYRLIVVDTGNNVRSPNWQAAVNAADAVVVVSTYQRDVAYSGSWVLDHLARTDRDELARNAITVLTASDPTVDKGVRAELLQHFGARTRAVVEIPYDPAIASGGPIRWVDLADGTRRAWTRAGAVVTRALADG